MKIRLALFIAVMLCTGIALGQTPDSPPNELVDGLFASWGNWPVFAGIAVASAVYLWRLFKPHVWGKLDQRYRRFIPPCVAGLTAASAALVAGSSWAVAGQVFVSTWASILFTGDTLIGVFGKPEAPPTQEPTIDEKLDEAFKKTLGGGLVVLFIAALLGGCSPSLQSVAAEPRPRTVGAVDNSKKCQRLSNYESALRYSSVGGAALAGGSGLATIPVEDDSARHALAITAASMAAFAVTSEAIRGELATDFARECE